MALTNQDESTKLEQLMKQDKELIWQPYTFWIGYKTCIKLAWDFVLTGAVLMCSWPVVHTNMKVRYPLYRCIKFCLLNSCFGVEALLIALWINIRKGRKQHAWSMTTNCQVDIQAKVCRPTLFNYSMSDFRQRIDR